jgi:hypothetical protein
MAITNISNSFQWVRGITLPFIISQRKEGDASRINYFDHCYEITPLPLEDFTENDSLTNAWEGKVMRFFVHAIDSIILPINTLGLDDFLRGISL